MLAIGFFVIIFIWALCLIFPLILVSKWRSRPVIALFSSAILCGLTLACLFVLMDIAVNGVAKMEISVAVVLGIFGSVFALPILAIVQVVKQQKDLAPTRKEISNIF